MPDRTAPVISFDRVVSPALEAALSAGGSLAWLLDAFVAAGPMVDVQLRAAGRTKSWVSAYLGLTKVLDVIESKGTFRLDVHTTHREASGFDHEWATAQPAESLTKARVAIKNYLAGILSNGAVDERYTGREGRVQSLMSTATHESFGVLQREAVPAFRSAPFRNALTVPLQQRMWGAVARQVDSPPWWPTVRNNGDATPRLGLEADLLGWDSDGRLLVIEVKPADAVEGIAWAPAQARMYAEVFAMWLEIDPNARAALTAMAAQRRRLGLPASTWALPDQSEIRVVPIIAIGHGTRSAQALLRLMAVHTALQSAPPLSARLDPLEVWHIDEQGGRQSSWRPGFDGAPS